MFITRYKRTAHELVMMVHYLGTTENAAHIPRPHQTRKKAQGNPVLEALGKNPSVFFRHPKETPSLPSGECLRSWSGNCISHLNRGVFEMKFICQLNNEKFHQKLTLIFTSNIFKHLLLMLFHLFRCISFDVYSLYPPRLNLSLLERIFFIKFVLPPSVQ